MEPYVPMSVLEAYNQAPFDARMPTQMEKLEVGSNKLGEDITGSGADSPIFFPFFVSSFSNQTK